MVFVQKVFYICAENINLQIALLNSQHKAHSIFYLRSSKEINVKTFRTHI